MCKAQNFMNGDIIICFPLKIWEQILSERKLLSPSSAQSCADLHQAI